MIGRKVGRLTVVSSAEPVGKLRRWNCACRCGVVVVKYSSQLSPANKFEASCGCARRDKTVARNFRHGMAPRTNRMPEYHVWRAMRERCQDTGDKNRVFYLDRGITVCDRWSDFPAFLADMGRRPSAGHSIDRIDNDGNYEPGNCRWATPVEQRHNQRRYIADHPEAAHG